MKVCEYQDRSGKSQCRARTNETENRCEYDRNEQRPEILRPYASNFLYNAAGEFRKEYGGPQQTDDGGVKYVLSDWQGSTRAIVGNTGHVQSRMDYSAFGESIGTGTGVRTAQQGFSVSDSLRQRYGLTERDEATGLDDTWFRKLENRGGRWTSPDPYNGSANIGNGQSWNRYSYVENQPTNFVDPSGLFMIGPRPPAPREQSWLEICWLLGICGNPTTSQGGEDFSGGGGPETKGNDLDNCIKQVKEGRANVPEASKEDRKSYYFAVLGLVNDLNEAHRYADRGRDTDDGWTVVKMGSGATIGALTGAALGFGTPASIGLAILGAGVGYGLDVMEHDWKSMEAKRNAHETFERKLNEARAQYPEAARRADYLRDTAKMIQNCHRKYSRDGRSWWSSMERPWWSS